VILLHASVGDVIGDGVVEGMHLNQKTVLVEWNTSFVGSELAQDLGIRGEGKLAPVHLDVKFLKIVASLQHGSRGCQTAHHDGILEDGTGNHAHHHHRQGQPVEECLAKLEDAVHLTIASPLTMVDGLERIQDLQKLSDDSDSSLNGTAAVGCSIHYITGNKKTNWNHPAKRQTWSTMQEMTMNCIMSEKRQSKIE